MTNQFRPELFDDSLYVLHNKKRLTSGSYFNGDIMMNNYNKECQNLLDCYTTYYYIYIGAANSVVGNIKDFIAIVNIVNNSLTRGQNGR
jgi:hypothetical protein